ncbi:MAG: hypothetical protein R3B06_03905 [Kofleriaceae bacterium]
MEAADVLSPRLLIAPDGSLLAQIGKDHIELRSAVTLNVDGEIGIDPEATASEVALTGDPLRLVVLAHYDDAARLHTIDPAGPTATGELTIRGSFRLAAAAGNHVWLTGPSGSVVVDVCRKDLAMWPLPLRTPIHAAGAFAGERFVVSTGGLIEEWDAASRAPVRRFRMTKPTMARFVGGGPRQVWLVPVTEPTRIDLIPIIKHGQPATIEVPEPIGRVVADRNSDNLLIIGATSRAAWTLDPSGRSPLARLDGVELDDAVWLPGTTSIVGAMAGGGLELVPIGGRARPVAAAPRAADSAPAEPAADPGAAGADDNIVDRLSAWRERIKAVAPRTAAPAPTRMRPANPSGWRDHVASWARSVLSGTATEAPMVDDSVLGQSLAALGLDDELADAVTLMYGAHLCGLDGVAAIDLATVTRRQWDEALGRGYLAQLGAVRWRRGRARLVREITDALDEHPPRRGTMVVSDAVVPAGQVAIIADASRGLDELATWLAPQLGPLLVPNERGLARLDRFVVEARVRQAVPLVPWPHPDVVLPPTAVAIVDDEATAKSIPAPVIGTWPLRR